MHFVSLSYTDLSQSQSNFANIFKMNEWRCLPGSDNVIIISITMNIDKNIQIYSNYDVVSVITKSIDILWYIVVESSGWLMLILSVFD